MSRFLVCKLAPRGQVLRGRPRSGGQSRNEHIRVQYNPLQVLRRDSVMPGFHGGHRARRPACISASISPSASWSSPCAADARRRFETASCALARRTAVSIASTSPSALTTTQQWAVRCWSRSSHVPGAAGAGLRPAARATDAPQGTALQPREMPSSPTNNLRRSASNVSGGTITGCIQASVWYNAIGHVEANYPRNLAGQILVQP